MAAAAGGLRVARAASCVPRVASLARRGGLQIRSRAAAGQPQQLASAAGWWRDTRACGCSAGLALSPWRLPTARGVHFRHAPGMRRHSGRTHAAAAAARRCPHRDPAALLHTNCTSCASVGVRRRKAHNGFGGRVERGGAAFGQTIACPSRQCGVQPRTSAIWHGPPSLDGHSA
jgi:hypothetical protein